MSFRKELLFSILTIGIVLACVEIFSSALLFYRFKKDIVQFDNTDMTGTSTYLLLKKSLQKAGIIPIRSNPITTSPTFLYRPDDYLGYALNPGRYIRTYTKYRGSIPEYFKINVTVNDNGTRFIGNHDAQAKTKIFIFGDSFVFGEGVNDEQTFAYLLQSAFPQYAVSLYAAGGYSLIQAYLNFERLKSEIGPNDIIVLGYADFYKTRNVAAPSRLREHSEGGNVREDPAIKQPRASISKDNELVIDLIPLLCKYIMDYCRQKDPSQAEMDLVTEKLFTKIVEETNATVLVLHMQGDRNDIVLKAIPKKAKVLSVTDESFDYKIRDSVMDFDSHPGPYWHYAVYTKLAALLRDNSLLKASPP